MPWLLIRPFTCLTMPSRRVQNATDRGWWRARDRDRAVIALVHGVLAADRAVRLVGFGSASTTRHRLVMLARRGVLARARRFRRPGSPSWRYTLGALGATVRAASTCRPAPTPACVALVLAESARLARLLAIAERGVAVDVVGPARRAPGRAALPPGWGASRPGTSTWVKRRIDLHRHLRMAGPRVLEGSLFKPRFG
jgi:hypothetical protein